MDAQQGTTLQGTMPPQAPRGFELLNIGCATCGAPATYDIVKHTYACAYCGNTTSVGQALKQKRGFRELRQRALQRQRDDFAALTCSCSGCGAKVVFPQGEVLQNCSFCGRALARGKYLKDPEFPELIVPFRLTPDEARARFQSWCDHNASKREARHLRSCLGDMQGYYLPYELIRGPIDCSVSREGAERTYACGGFLNSVFVNTSAQLDNLTLNGMEPFDLRELSEFEFGYLAQQKAKVDEIGRKELNVRVRQEVAAGYRPVVEKTLETKNLNISPRIDDLVRMPVLLPVYYISKGSVCAAVNGQTGKVAVRCETARKTMPWWIRPIVATLAVFVVALVVAARLLGNWEGGLVMAGGISLVMGLIFYTAFSNAYEGQKRQTLDPKIFSTSEVFERAPDGSLRVSNEKIEEDPVTPVFFEDVDGVRTQVGIRFSTAGRMLKMLLLAFFVAFLPTLVAFVLNGLSLRGLHLGGAAVWLCIFVPVSIAYFVKMGRMDIYENPDVYVTDERGQRRKIKTKSRTTTVRDIVGVVFSPSLIVLAVALVIFFVMGVYLTLGN